MKETSFDPAQAFEQAVSLFQQGRLDDAETISRRLLTHLPGNFDALHLLGVIDLRRGRPAAALEHFQSALRANPDSPDALSNLAVSFSALHRVSEALAVLNRAQALAPNDWKILNGRGSVLLQMNRAGDALADFEQALAIEPRHPGPALNRGNALAKLGRAAEALAQFDALIAAHPNLAEAHFNRGNALAGLDRTSQAIEAYDTAISLRPDYLKARLSRSVALQTLNRHRDSIADLDRILAADPANADAHNNAALALLTLGDYRRGFAEYDWRWRRTGMPPPRVFAKPLWLGEEPLAGRTILLHSEQGFGDTIQFVRYAPILARAGTRVVLESPTELATLLGRVEGLERTIVRGEPLPQYDVHCPLGTLPRALRTEVSSIPRNVPYLTVSEEKLANWRARLAGISSPRIAIAWSGSPNHPNDRNRSVPLSLLEPILILAGLNLISIQREVRTDVAAVMASLPGVVQIGDELRDFDDTAAVLSLVDAVVSVDTAVAHLAGALGRPTWILLPFSPDWRWMLDRDDCLWYPTARLFRQPAPGDWGEVIRKVIARLHIDGFTC